MFAVLKQIKSIKHLSIMKATKQVIVNSNGNSWLGFYTTNKRFNESLKIILELSLTEKYQTEEGKNSFWVIDLEGFVVAAQPSLTGAMKYYNENRILIHLQPLFV